MRICVAVYLFLLVAVCDSWKKGFDDFFISDHRCGLQPTVPIESAIKCKPRGWYFDRKTRHCLPSCNTAPFVTQFECIGACRSVAACGFPVESSLCLLHVSAVYSYDPIARECVMIYDCSLFGNKFPTYKECKYTCEGGRFEALTPGISYESLLVSGQQRLIGHTGSSQSQIGQGQVTWGSQANGSLEIFNNSLHQQTTSSQSVANTSTGATIGSTEHGQKEHDIQTSSGTKVTGATGLTTNEVTTSQSSFGGVMGVTQATSGMQQQAGQTSTSVHVGATGAVTNEVIPSESKVGGGSSVGQTTSEMEKSSGSSKEGSIQTGKFGSMEVKQGIPKELKLPTLKVSKSEPPPLDKDCYIIAPRARGRDCRRRWYYDREKGVCRPSCSKKAPFSNDVACDGVCRSLEACDFPMASMPCLFLPVHGIYYYNQYRKKCMKGYDCTFFGNKFPTLNECQETCKKYEARLAAKVSANRSSKVYIRREKIISNMAHRQLSQSKTASEKGSAGSQTSQGTGQHQQSSIASSSSQASSQMSKTGATETEKGGQSASGISAGLGLTRNEIERGGEQRQTQTSTTSGTQGSTEPLHSSGQLSETHGEMSTGVGLQTNEIQTGGQHQGGSFHAGSSSISGQMTSSDASAGHQASLTTLGVSGSSSTKGQLQVTGVSTGSVSHGQLQETGVSTGSTSQVQIQQTAGACGAAVQTALCLFEVYAMYAYDPISTKCFMVYDCALYGNKFATLKECQQTCEGARKFPRYLPNDRQKIIKMNESSQSIMQSSGVGGAVSQLLTGQAQTSGATQVSGQQHEFASTQQQATASQSTTTNEVTAALTAIGIGQNAVEKSTVSGKQLSIQAGKLRTLEEQQKYLKELKLPSVKVTKSKRPSVDKDCLFEAPETLRNDCRRKRWYYHSKSRSCRPTCSRKAPFSNEVACDGVCRSLQACDFPMAGMLCLFLPVHKVYVYNQNTKRCFMGYDCSYFGNKFPTIQECEETCRIYEERNHVNGSMKGTPQATGNKDKLISKTTREAIYPPGLPSRKRRLGSQASNELPNSTQLPAGDIGVRSAKVNGNGEINAANEVPQGDHAGVLKTASI